MGQMELTRIGRIGMRFRFWLRCPIVRTKSQRPAPFTVELLASELPESIVKRFPQPLMGNMRFIVTVKPIQSEKEKWTALQHTIQEGLKEIEAGRVIDGATVFSELNARFPTL